MKNNINKNYEIKQKKEYHLDEYIQGIRLGNRYVLSKAITLLESKREADYKLSTQLLDACLPFTGKAKRIGISGVPGVGKSTFIESFGMYLINTFNVKVAVLTIDPSSSKSGGSILGDKTRMDKLAATESAYIRPSASSGNLGGVASRSRESILLCEAAGFDIILVETVGVGQSESQVHSMVDFFLLLMLCGAGDELQGYKRGIMEMADGFVITKADHENLKKAAIFKQELANAIHYLPAHENNWITEVFLSSALLNEGLDTIWDHISSYFEKNKKWIIEKRKEQQINWFNENNQYLIEKTIMDKNSILLKSLYKKIKEEKISIRTASDLFIKEIIKD
jgi:LAO/AO transport system kinase